jgi:hypothetical protein
VSYQATAAVTAVAMAMNVTLRLLRRHARRLKVAQQGLCDALNTVRVFQMLGYLAHQFTLVDCGELTATLLMPASKLVHFFLSSLNIGAQVASITTTCYTPKLRTAPPSGSAPGRVHKIRAVTAGQAFRQ